MKRDDDLPDSTPSPEEQVAPEEQARADARRHAVDDRTDPVALLLAAAVSPGDLPEDVHERILARVLGDDALSADEPPADAREREAAEALRRALEAPVASREEHELASLADAFRNAHAPRALSEIRNEALLRPALRSSGRGAPRALFAAAAGVLAVAASVAALWITGSQPPAPGPAAHMDYAPKLVEARSTAPLFSVEDFPQGGGKTSERIDKISAARAADLRKNRYLAWGIE